MHTYSVAANGAIGKQVPEINTQSYGGAECGTTNGATLDHTGSYVYVSLNGALESGDQFCATIQTFQISSSGVLTFKGDTVLNTFKEIDTPPVVSGNDTFAYNLQQVSESCELMINGFTRESSGTLELSSISETDPPTQPNVWAAYIPALMTADPTNHLAVAMYPTNGPCGPTGPFQLASFTEESQGDIKSTNTWRNMPALAGGVNAMRMSPAGNLLAVATGAGVQIFHFNGANPITKYTGVLGTGGISYLYWDNSNHLFAAGGTKLHVFTVTTTSAVEAPGSPYTIPSGVSALVVRPL